MPLPFSRKAGADNIFTVYFFRGFVNNEPVIAAFHDAVKFNCDVSDARFWGHFSICGLLMRYRDLYRSEQGLEPWSPIPLQEISAWIEKKESRWPDIEQEAFRQLPCEDRPCDPFDAASVNRSINPQGYVYGAGLGMYMKPTFFLARLRSAAIEEGHQVLIAEDELIRDLFTAPAMLQERTIFLRIDPLKALLWDAFCRVRPGCASALADAFTLAGISPGQKPNGEFSELLGGMTDRYLEVLLWHELAESRERIPDWKALLAATADRTAELMLRAVQDLVADTSDRGPLHRIIQRRDKPSLAIMIGLLDGLRKALFPEIRQAYLRFDSEKRWDDVEDARLRGYERFAGLRRSLLDAYVQGGEDAFQQMLRDLVLKTR